VSSLTPERTLAAHRLLHLAALGLLVTGVITGLVAIVQAALALALAAAITFAAFFIFVLLRLRGTKGSADVLQPSN